MRTLIVGECAPDRLYRMTDPDAPNEAEFEFAVVKALSCVYSSYRCVVFGGGFRYDDRVYRPDLALVARDFSHWFVIEVELVSHSFDGHVLPQVRAFQYGFPEPDCATVLARELAVSREQARTLIDFVPHSVAVVANKREARWEIALRALTIQMLTISVFRSVKGVDAMEVDGTLEVLAESLGFGIYSATDRSLRFHKTLRLPAGPVQIDDPAGAPASWTVTPSDGATWVTKDVGAPDIEHGTHLQLIRTVDGRLSFRRPR